MLGRLGGKVDPSDAAVVHEDGEELGLRIGETKGPCADADEAWPPRRRAEAKGGRGSLRPDERRPVRGRLESRPAGGERPGGRSLLELGALGRRARGRVAAAPGPEDGRQEKRGDGPAGEAQGVPPAPPSSRVSPYRAARERAPAISSGVGARSSGGWSRAR